MKKYETPTILLVELQCDDIIASSALSLTDFNIDDEMSQDFGIIPD